MRHDCYDKEGNPIDRDRYIELKYDPPNNLEDGYKRVASTILDNRLWVSTVWLGDNLNPFDGPPIIFETLVFESYETLGKSLDCERYSTLEEAEAGHREMVKRWQTADMMT